jgi:hypothetical protein
MFSLTHPGRILVRRGAPYCLVIATALGIAPHARADDVPLQCNDFQISLRSDFNDLGPTKCPTSYATAQGASLSFGYNELTSQTSAGLDGLIAATRYFPGVISEGNPFIGASIGLFAQGSDTYLFQPASGQNINSDTVTVGGFGQLALNNSIVPDGYDLFRVRGGYVQASTGAFFYSYVAEWVPIYGNLGQGIRFFNTPINSVVSPELMVQYDSFGGGPNKYLIFANNREDLRVGPQMVLQFNLGTLHAGDTAWAPLAPWSALIAYHSSWNEFTGHNFSWTSTSITYTFGAKRHFDTDKDLTPTAAAHVGLSLSYGYGNSETTGNLTSQWKLGLSVKF